MAGFFYQRFNIAAGSADKARRCAVYRRHRAITKTRAKKNRPAGRLFSQADYFEAAGAAAAAEAADEAAEAALEAAAAASEAAEAAAAAAGAAASAAGAGAGAGAGSAATGAGAAGASSFFEQAARATASRETISRDFFMGFP